MSQLPVIILTVEQAGNILETRVAHVGDWVKTQYAGMQPIGTVTKRTLTYRRCTQWCYPIRITKRRRNYRHSEDDILVWQEPETLPLLPEGGA